MKYITDSLYAPIGEFENHFAEFFEKLFAVHKISLPPLSLLLIYTSESEILRKFFKNFLFYFNFFLDYVYYDGNIGHDGHEKSDRLIGRLYQRIENTVVNDSDQEKTESAGVKQFFALTHKGNAVSHRRRADAVHKSRCKAPYQRKQNVCALYPFVWRWLWNCRD